MSDAYAVIGNPIGHTKSPLIHGLFAEATGQDMVYTAIEGRIGQFAADMDKFRAAGGRGMNVTAPFKLDAFACATERSPRAQMAGAVNALKFDGERVIAVNTAAAGRSIRPSYHFTSSTSSRANTVATIATITWHWPVRTVISTRAATLPALTPTRISRSARSRRPRWSPICVPTTSTVSWRPIRSTSARSTTASASYTSCRRTSGTVIRAAPSPHRRSS